MGDPDLQEQGRGWGLALGFSLSCVFSDQAQFFMGDPDLQGQGLRLSTGFHSRLCVVRDNTEVELSSGLL